MSSNNMAAEFKKFMKAKKVWRKWVSKFNKYWGHTNYTEWLTDVSTEVYIDAAFIWHRAEYSFWIKIHNDWLKHLEQLEAKGGEK